MPRPSKAERRRTNARRELAAKGWTAILVGLLMLVVLPLFMRGPMLSTLGQAFRPAGWLALAIGVVLLGLHYILRRVAAPLAAERPQASQVFKAARPSAPGKVARHEEPAPPSVPSADPPAPSSAEPTPRQREPQWSPTVLAAIEWRRFEALCKAFYAQVGLTTRSQSHGADGGVDI